MQERTTTFDKQPHFIGRSGQQCGVSGMGTVGESMWAIVWCTLRWACSVLVLLLTGALLAEGTPTGESGVSADDRRPSSSSCSTTGSSSGSVGKRCVNQTNKRDSSARSIRCYYYDRIVSCSDQKRLATLISHPTLPYLLPTPDTSSRSFVRAPCNGAACDRPFSCSIISVQSPKQKIK